MTQQSQKAEDTDGLRYYLDGDEQLSEAVVKAVAACSSEPPSREAFDPTDLTRPPLYETVDPEALDSLFHNRKTARNVGGVVSFTYVGYEVTVHGEEYVEVASTVEE